MIWHYKTPKQEAYQKAVQLLELVGITDAEKRMKKLSAPALRRYAPARGYRHRVGL